jgi:hypothetical protein
MSESYLQGINSFPIFIDVVHEMHFQTQSPCCSLSVDEKGYRHRHGWIKASAEACAWMREPRTQEQQVNYYWVEVLNRLLSDFIHCQPKTTACFNSFVRLS